MTRAPARKTTPALFVYALCYFALYKLLVLVLRLLPDRQAVSLEYFAAFRSLPNLRAPQALNEKIAWRKLYQRDPLFTIYSDKIAVKREVANIIGERHVIETLWTGERPQDIPFDALVPPYVIKVNHSFGRNIFIKERSDIRREEIIKSMTRQLKRAHGRRHREWGYVDIPRKVLVERMLILPDGSVPNDYKFFVYGGRVGFIQLDLDRFAAHTRSLYDRDWNKVEGMLNYGAPDTEIDKPDNLEKLIEIAEAIGSKFDFVRVDLYDAPDNIYFGETTFYPAAGLGRFTPLELDQKFGAPWRIESEPARATPAHSG